jgi:5-(carboxyamino)imidazole ribonucleotide synthase
MVNVFGSMDLGRYSRVAQSSDVKLHNYGKEPRGGRKVGHVTATGTDVADTTSRARAVAEIFHADI